MKTENPEEKLSAALRAADVVVAYAPLPDEQEFVSFLKENGVRTVGVSVLTDRTTDPNAYAESLAKRYAEQKVVLLIPGRAFDASGTRHGRGGGWYDRFLATVPRAWLRVGVLSVAEFSKETLPRESWDEPMDWLLISNGGVWHAQKASAQDV